MRKRHDRHWHSHNEKDHKKSKEDKDGHGQFICVLQRVREILQTRMPTASAREKSVNESTVNGNTVNTFEILELQETSASFLDSKPIHYGKKPTITPTAQWDMDRGSDVDEADFAVDCLFNDLQTIRTYLQQIWQSYKDGELGLLSVSITTNTTIEIARDLEDDFVEAFGEPNALEVRIFSFYVELFAAEADPFFMERPDEFMNFALYENAKLMSFPAWVSLTYFSATFNNNQYPDGLYNALRDKFYEDHVLLMESLPEFEIIVELFDRYGPLGTEDEMTRGMRDLFKKGK